MKPTIRTFERCDVRKAIDWAQQTYSRTKAERERCAAAIDLVERLIGGGCKWTLKTDVIQVVGRTDTYIVQLLGDKVICTCIGYTKYRRMCYHRLALSLIIQAAHLYQRRPHETQPAVAELTA